MCLFTCLYIAVVAGLFVADILPAAPGRWNWTGTATGVLVYIILLFAFTRRQR